MKQSYFIGADNSKSKNDFAVLSCELVLLKEKVVKNSDSNLKAFFINLFKELKIEASAVLVCCENTGIYSRPLERVCRELGIDLWVEHPLKIKRASTDMRGKNDRQDALRIAEYAIRYQDKQVLYQEPTDVVKDLDRQIKIRETLIGQKVALENQLREAQSHDYEEFKALKEGYKIILKSLEKSILKAENKINELIKNDEQVSQNVELMTTIPGIGKQNAVNLIIATNNFKTFNSAKHLACYAGVVPFQNQSGTIIKRDRVSKMANKTLKKLLHMAAMAAIRFDSEIKAYYIRKVREGKNKMSVLNAVRNKLIHRIMAVITRKTPYVVVN
jgi:transposase